MTDSNLYDLEQAIAKATEIARRDHRSMYVSLECGTDSIAPSDEHRISRHDPYGIGNPADVHRCWPDGTVEML